MKQDFDLIYPNYFQSNLESEGLSLFSQKLFFTNYLLYMRNKKRIIQILMDTIQI